MNNRPTILLYFLVAVFCRAINFVICADSPVGTASTKQSFPFSVILTLGTVRKKATKD